MKSLLFITRNFPPLIGGMERLAFESVQALAAEWRVSLVGPKGCEGLIGGNACGVAYGTPGRFLFEGWRAARRMRGLVDHDVVVGGSGLAAPLVRAASRRAGVLNVCFIHGLDLVVEHPFYRLLALPALRDMELLIANSNNTARLARQLGIDPGRIQVLHPGVEVDSGADSALFNKSFPAALGRRLLLSVGRLLPRKGLVDFVCKSLSQIVARDSDVMLVVAGGPARDALLNSGNEEARLAQAISDTGMQDHVLLTGQLEEEVLASLYTVAEVMVFPVKDLPGDVEGFGMVALEAAAHGVPTVAFAAGGVADAVADGRSGALISPGDYAGFADHVSAFLDHKHGTVSAGSCRAFARRFAWPQYARSLRRVVAEQSRAL